jgi:hypothetical protein
MIQAATFIRIGNGERVKFWFDNWLPEGISIARKFPQLVSFVGKSSITVAQALRGNRWVRDIRSSVSLVALGQYLCLCDIVCSIQLQPDIPDSMVWRHSVDGSFSTAGAYSLFFAANIRFPCANAIWKSKATPRCKFFMWLVVHQRCLTADNLQRRGWPNTATCQLCLAAPETCTHLFLHCPFSIQLWQVVKDWARADFPSPDASSSTEEWWLLVRKRAPKSVRRDFDAVVILVH